MADWNDPEIDKLLEAFLSLESKQEAKAFLRDLLTDSEISEFSKRWQVARLLTAGSSYTAIEKETGLSSTTIARISKWLQEGEGGYRLMLDKLNQAGE